MNGVEELMKGVRVLNTIPAQKTMGIGLYIGVGILIWFLISFTVGLMIMGNRDMLLIVRVAAISGVVVGAVFGGGFYIRDSADDLPQTYEVTISSGADAKEFCERFEIVEKNGEIYRIKERDE